MEGGGPAGNKPACTLHITAYWLARAALVLVPQAHALASLERTRPVLEGKTILLFRIRASQGGGFC